MIRESGERPEVVIKPECEQEGGGGGVGSPWTAQVEDLIACG